MVGNRNCDPLCWWFSVVPIANVYLQLLWHFVFFVIYAVLGLVVFVLLCGKHMFQLEFGLTF